MTTISEDFTGLTMINSFRPPAGEMARLRDLLIATTDAFSREADGFVSANFHLSKDGATLINYAQWASFGHFKATMDGPLGQHWFGLINAICEPEVIVCDVIYVSTEHPEGSV